MEDKLYWVWLSLLFSAGSAKPAQILACCDSPEEFYAMSAEEMRAFGVLNPQDVKAAKALSLKRAELVLNHCEERGIRVVAWNDDEFPKRLRLMYGPPIVLYVKGSLSGLDDEVVITVVGTRKSTDYSEYVTQYLSANLAAAGAVIVSGCAVGIDTNAHQGALLAKGRTVAVLGCGLDVDYPKENFALKQEILEQGGALISELPPGTEPISRLFPVRNRIMAGLALGVLVTHAPERSGSLITAELAVEQGKEVFCVPPYSIFDSSYFGVIRYLRDGAIPVFCADDVLGMYTGAYAHKLDVSRIQGDYVKQKRRDGKTETVSRPAEKKTKTQPEETFEDQQLRRDELKKKYLEIITAFDEKQLLVYNSLEFTPRLLDELAAATGLPVGELLSLLTELEILGLVVSLDGRRYALDKQ